MYNKSDPYNLNKLLTAIFKYHNVNNVVGDLRPSNIMTTPIGEIDFRNINQKELPNLLEEKQKDLLKFFLLAKIYYLKEPMTKTNLEMLGPNSKITDEDIAKEFKGKAELYQEIKYVSGYYNDSNEKKGSTNKQGGKIYTKNNGHPIEVETNKPNAFISLFLFPFVTLYLFFILALLYWMIVIVSVE